MAASLPAPGVQVTQQFVVVSPTIITPTLPACVVGVCKQLVDVVTTSSSGSSSLNSQALIALPGFFVAPVAGGTPPIYAGLDGLNLVLSITNGPDITITFSGASLTPATVVSQIAAAFTAAGVTEALAETVGANSFRVRTVGTGGFQTLYVVPGAGKTSAAVASAFDIIPGYVYPGRPSYDQYDFVIPPSNMPDPRNNLAELSIEWDTVRVFLALGNGADIYEVSRMQSFLSNGGQATTASMTGSIDLSTLSYSTPATTTGTTDATSSGLYGTGGTLHGSGTGLTLKINDEAGGLLSLTFNGNTNAANEAAMLAAIEATWPSLTATVVSTHLVLTDVLFGAPSTFIIDPSSTALTALGLTAATYTGTNGTITNQPLTLNVNGTGNQLIPFSYPNNLTALLAQINGVVSPALVATHVTDLVLTTVATGYATSINVVSGAAAALLGLTVSAVVHGVNGVAAIDDGNGDAVTPLIQMNGANFMAAASAASVVGTANVGSLSYPSALLNMTLTLSDGAVPQTLIFDSTISSTSALTAAIEAFWPNFTVDILSTHLRIRSVAVGSEGIVEVVGGTSLAPLGLTISEAHGSPFPPASGDQLWIDGVLYGIITQVAPGGVNTVLKINKQVPINPSLGSSFYIMAQNLTGEATATRPSSDLIIDLLDNVHIKHEILRDTTGTPLPSSLAQVYVAYTAVREDVTAMAANPGLLTFSSTTDLANQLSPVTPDNPLAMGIYFALLNGPSTQVMGLGVDAISPSEPFGTVDAFTRAAEYLEAFEVYGIAPLTHDPSVGQVFMAHIDAMSDPTMKGERVCIFNSAKPVTKTDTIVTSGTNGNSATSLTFDTGVHNMSQLLLGAGVSPVGTIPVSAGVYLVIAANALNYSVTSITGSLVTIKVSGFAAGENDDGFYSTTDLATPPLPNLLIEEAFAIHIRGAALVLTDGVTPDKDGIAATIQQIGQGYNDRRFWNVVPDQCAATVNGLEQVLDGFYMCAAIAGAVGQQAPQQSFTNYPIVGFTRVIGSTNYFSVKQLNVIRAGGNWIMIQPSAGAPLLPQMALTTNMTSVETRTDSITKVVDFVAKFIRNGLKNFIGRFNISQGFLDTLGHVLQGLLAFLQDQGTLNGSTVKQIIQDTEIPDTVLISVELNVPYPCNFINLTLVI